MATATPTRPKKLTAAQKKKQDAADDKAALAANDGMMPKDGELFETQTISPVVKRRANKYRDASVTKSQANTAFNSARDGLLDAMGDEGVDSVIIELGGVRKRIVRESPDVLKIVTVKEIDDSNDTD